VIAAGVFNSGLLADPNPGATFDYTPASPERIERAQRLRRICMDHGVSLRAAALQFAQRGYKRARIGDIIREAGVTPPMFYDPEGSRRDG